MSIGPIEQAAVWATQALHCSGMADVSFAPGDMTEYRFTITAPAPERYRCGEILPGRYYVVSLHSFGRTYEWRPESNVSAEYCAEKWTRNYGEGLSDMHTGEVVAVFLNLLGSDLRKLWGVKA